MRGGKSVELRCLSGPAPLLVCCDLQNEGAAAPHRALDCERALHACENLLALWRRRFWPIAHLKRVSDRSWFNLHDRGRDWIATTRPRPGELTFEHCLPSAYSSPHYVEYMRSMRDIGCILAGFALEDTIVATAIEGFHRSHRYYLAADAVACRQPASGNARAYRQVAIDIVQNFAGKLRTADLCEA
jgi:nicotinamidase-related amidase